MCIRDRVGAALRVRLDGVLPAVGQRRVDVGPQRLAVAEAEEHLLVVADDHGALGHDQPVGHLLPDGHADVHAVHELSLIHISCAR